MNVGDLALVVHRKRHVFGDPFHHETPCTVIEPRAASRGSETIEFRKQGDVTFGAGGSYILEEAESDQFGMNGQRPSPSDAFFAGLFTISAPRKIISDLEIGNRMLAGDVEHLQPADFLPACVAVVPKERGEVSCIVINVWTRMGFLEPSFPSATAGVNRRFEKTLQVRSCPRRP